MSLYVQKGEDDYFYRIHAWVDKRKAWYDVDTKDPRTAANKAIDLLKMLNCNYSIRALERLNK